ncbi:DUF1775 domain-containing protein [Dactylosporangium sp. NPDC051485]|uniref:DUF1775 domain-containing protein n=1 Tax=Dactylosporangium sp. NPDC051485 TaxID=3154846 RepID=UPI003434D76D
MPTRRLRPAVAYPVAIAAGAATVLLAATPAAAHVKVAADKAQAGARDVTITFTGEGESARAGIEAERVVLPAGIAIADVQLVSAPPGWTFTAAEDGYTVSGPALRPRADAVHTIRVARLPATAHALAFKTLETYSDGSVARWIDLPEAGNPEPEHPAPVLTLRPAAAPSTAGAVPVTGPSSTGGAPAAGPDISGPAIAQPAPAGRNTAGTVAAIALMSVALLLVAGVLVLVVVLRRRSTTP